MKKYDYNQKSPRMWPNPSLPSWALHKACQCTRASRIAIHHGQRRYACEPIALELVELLRGYQGKDTESPFVDLTLKISRARGPICDAVTHRSSVLVQARLECSRLRIAFTRNMVLHTVLRTRPYIHTGRPDTSLSEHVLQSLPIQVPHP